MISTNGFPLKKPISLFSSICCCCCSGSFSVNGVVSLECAGSRPQSSRGDSKRLAYVSTVMSRAVRLSFVVLLVSRASAPCDAEGKKIEGCGVCGNGFVSPVLSSILLLLLTSTRKTHFDTKSDIICGN